MTENVLPERSRRRGPDKVGVVRVEIRTTQEDSPVWGGLISQFDFAAVGNRRRMPVIPPSTTKDAPAVDVDRGLAK